MRWLNPSNSRYYAAQLQQDLLQDWTVIVCWGKQGMRSGRRKIVHCENTAAAQAYLTKLNRLRLYRGYQRIN